MESGGGGVNNSKEMEDMKERLRISETLMSEMTKTWEEKLRETEKLHHVRTLDIINLFIKTFLY
jgi:kinesin family protein 13